VPKAWHPGPAPVPVSVPNDYKVERRCQADSGERGNFAKVRVDGSNPFARSIFRNKYNYL